MPNMHQPNTGLVVTISLDFLCEYMEYSKLIAVFIIASHLGPMGQNKVDIYFEIQ
jgi:hypothetical protein